MDKREIAQRFNAGDVCHTRTSPEGTAERLYRPVQVQPSLRDSNLIDPIPALKRRAIIGLSLRDKSSSNLRKALTQGQLRRRCCYFFADPSAVPTIISA